MAYTVAKTLHIRPKEVLIDWSCEEVLVTFGVYMNDLAYEKYSEYQGLDTKTKGKVPAPPEYAIKFITLDQLEELNQPVSEEEKLEEQEMLLKAEAFMKGGGVIRGE